jgi:membrane dipeptidase
VVGESLSIAPVVKVRVRAIETSNCHPRRGSSVRIRENRSADIVKLLAVADMRILIATLFAAIIVASGCRETPQPIAITDEAARLSHQALIANLHSDFAMFKSGLSREEGVNLVGASIVSEESGIGSWLTFWWLGWSAEARRTPHSRALAQLDLIDRLVSSDRRLRVIRSREDLEEVSAKHSTGILICMEGGAALVDDVSRVRTFFDRGVRVISLTHLNNNELGGSGSPSIPLTNLSLQGDAGLTELGRSLLGEMRKYGMVVDLAHASARTFADILAEWSGPVIVSHTAMAAIYPSTRNTTDAQLRAISARDGIVGVLSQTQLLGGKHLSNLADHIVHAVRVAGADHVALGLDLEEIVNVAPLEFPDTRDVPKLTSLLLERGLKPEEVEKVLGLNAFRFFSRVLPPSPGH